MSHPAVDAQSRSNGDVASLVPMCVERGGLSTIIAADRYVPKEGLSVARFVTIGYGDQEGYDRTDATVRDEAHAHDARLHAAGAVMGIAGSPVQVRKP